MVTVSSHLRRLSLSGLCAPAYEPPDQIGHAGDPANQVEGNGNHQYPEDIDAYLRLSRMHRSQQEDSAYTRVINPGEGFTPPGLFFGLFYAWYLDNRFAANIEYKMSIMRNGISDLIPEQVRIVDRRRKTISFFRERIFRQRSPLLSGKVQ